MMGVGVGDVWKIRDGIIRTPNILQNESPTPPVIEK